MTERDEEILALHRQVAAERLRADQGWERAEAKSRECIELRDRLAAYASPMSNGWLPIEIAPRDGSLILLGRAEDAEEDRNGESVPGRWHDEDHDGPDNMGHDAGFMDDSYDGTFFCGRSFGNPAYQNKGYQPTHWQPLPQAPAKETSHVPT